MTSLPRGALLVMRHAQAVASDYRTPDDNRWLTLSGREAARAAAIDLGRYGVAIDGIVSSPLARALQTAEIVAQALDHRGEIATLESLRSESVASRALDDLHALGGLYLAVTHEPLASALCSIFAGRSQASLRTAELRHFDGGRLVWRR